MYKIKKIKPLFNSIITTMDKYEEVKKTSSGLIDVTKSDSLKEYQTVIAVGPHVRDIKAGDVVCVNPKRYGVKKHKEGTLKDGIVTDNPVITYNFNVVVMDDVQYLMITDSDIDFVIEEGEEVAETASNKPELITPDPYKIII